MLILHVKENNEDDSRDQENIVNHVRIPDYEKEADLSHQICSLRIVNTLVLLWKVDPIDVDEPHEKDGREQCDSNDIVEDSVLVEPVTDCKSEELSDCPTSTPNKEASYKAGDWNAAI